MRAAPVMASPAEDVLRGASRALAAAGHVVVAELPLANGRRADLVALDRRGRISIVEVKSSRADFVSDRKWHAYLDHCDRFYFAVSSRFPQSLLPVGHGLIVADQYAGEIIRNGSLRRLQPARRKALLIRFAHVAGGRLQALLDPACFLD